MDVHAPSNVVPEYFRPFYLVSFGVSYPIGFHKGNAKKRQTHVKQAMFGTGGKNLWSVLMNTRKEHHRPLGYSPQKIQHLLRATSEDRLCLVPRIAAD